MNRLGVCQTDDTFGMKALSDGESFCLVLVGALARDQRRAVMRRGSRGVAPVANEVVLGLGGIRSAAVSVCGGEKRGPFAIEGDQLPGDRLPFGGVGV